MHGVVAKLSTKFAAAAAKNPGAKFRRSRGEEKIFAPKFAAVSTLFVAANSSPSR